MHGPMEVCSFRDFKDSIPGPRSLISVFLPNDLFLDDWYAGLCPAHSVA